MAKRRRIKGSTRQQPTAMLRRPIGQYIFKGESRLRLTNRDFGVRNPDLIDTSKYKRRADAL